MSDQAVTQLKTWIKKQLETGANHKVTELEERLTAVFPAPGSYAGRLTSLDKDGAIEALMQGYKENLMPERYERLCDVAINITKDLDLE